MGRTSGEGLKNKIRELRARHRLTQADLAREVSCSRQTIVAIEKGEYNPSVIMALRISKILEEPIESIFWIEE